METTLSAEDEVEVSGALRRSTVYRFLSLAFLPPGDDLGPLREEGAGAVAALGALERRDARAAAEEAAQTLRDGDAAALQAEYYRVFGHQISRDCPLHETQYGAAHVFQQAQHLADIAGFYLAFGLEVADGAGERPDHISLELEFMHALAYREAYARRHHGPAEVEQLRAAQAAFLRDHLTRWVPVMARLVRRRTDGVYAAAADLAATWIAADAATFAVPVAEEVEFRPEESLDPAEGLAFCAPPSAPEDRT